MKSPCITIAVMVCIALTSIANIAGAATTARVLSVEPADPKGKQIDAQTIKEFEATNPGTKVEIEYLENEAFQTKLPTVLQYPLSYSMTKAPIPGRSA